MYNHFHSPALNSTIHILISAVGVPLDGVPCEEVVGVNAGLGGFFIVLAVTGMVLSIVGITFHLVLRNRAYVCRYHISTIVYPHKTKPCPAWTLIKKACSSSEEETVEKKCVLWINSLRVWAFCPNKTCKSLINVTILSRGTRTGVSTTDSFMEYGMEYVHPWASKVWFLNWMSKSSS